MQMLYSRTLYWNMIPQKKNTVAYVSDAANHRRAQRPTCQLGSCASQPCAGAERACAKLTVLDGLAVAELRELLAGHVNVDGLAQFHCQDRLVDRDVELCER